MHVLSSCVVYDSSVAHVWLMQVRRIVRLGELIIELLAASKVSWH